MSTEPLNDWEKRVLDVVNEDAAKRSEALDAHAATLRLESVDVDAATLKQAYRSRCKEAHPDARGASGDDGGGGPDINSCRVAFEAISAHLDRRETDASYEKLGGATTSTFKVLAAIPDAPDAFPGDAAATRVDPDLCLPFLLRNVQRAARQAQAAR